MYSIKQIEITTFSSKINFMDVVQYNSMAWDKCAERKGRWSVPVTKQEIDDARKGKINVVLTPVKPIPVHWLPPLKHARVLCLASGGGQQAPIFAAAGAKVTSFDNSQKQLLLDKQVCDENNLPITIIQGDMMDLSRFADGEFDFVFNPCSVAFIQDVTVVWRQVYRLLAKDGVFMSGFYNPIALQFREKEVEKGKVVLRYKQPYSDLTSLSKKDLQYFIDNDEPLIHGHSLNHLLGEQMRLGLRLTDMFEDVWDHDHALNNFFPCFIATRAVK